MIRYLSLADIQYLITRALDQSPQTVVRDWGLLESALHRPAATVFGTEAYPNVHTKTAALVHSLTRNHPLADGNKRLSWLAARLFYARNDLDLRAGDPQSANKLIRSVAGGTHDVDTLAALLAEWCHDLEA